MKNRGKVMDSLDPLIETMIVDGAMKRCEEDVDKQDEEDVKRGKKRARIIFWLWMLVCLFSIVVDIAIICVLI